MTDTNSVLLIAAVICYSRQFQVTLSNLSLKGLFLSMRALTSQNIPRMLELKLPPEVTIPVKFKTIGKNLELKLNWLTNFNR